MGGKREWEEIYMKEIRQDKRDKERGRKKGGWEGGRERIGRASGQWQVEKGFLRT